MFIQVLNQWVAYDPFGSYDTPVYKVTFARLAPKQRGGPLLPSAKVFEVPKGKLHSLHQASKAGMQEAMDLASSSAAPIRRPGEFGPEPDDGGFADPVGDGLVRYPNAHGEDYLARKMGSIGTDVDQFVGWLSAGFSFMLIGEPGSGKTAGTHAACGLLGRTPTVIDCQSDLTVADAIGGLTPVGTGFEPAYGPIGKCMLEGGILFLDDLGMASRQVFEALYPVLQDGKARTADLREIKAAPGFVVVAATNPVDMHGIPEALMERFFIKAQVESHPEVLQQMGADGPVLLRPLFEALSAVGGTDDPSIVSHRVAANGINMWSKSDSPDRWKIPKETLAKMSPNALEAIALTMREGALSIIIEGAGGLESLPSGVTNVVTHLETEHGVKYGGGGFGVKGLARPSAHPAAA